MKSTLVRKRRSVLSAYDSAKKDMDAAIINYDQLHARVVGEVAKILAVYARLKAEVSPVDWSTKTIAKVKVRGRRHQKVQVKLQSVDPVSGDVRHTYWDFPAWLVGADSVRIEEELVRMLAEEGLKYQGIVLEQVL